MNNASHVYPDAPRAEMLTFIPRTAQRVLDVGCHNGLFGERLRETLGAEVWGIEPNEQAANRAAKRLDRVVSGMFDDSAAVPDGYFDVVVFNDSLEHMTDPWAALRLAAKKLTRTGVVVASIPNFRHVDNLVHVLFERDFRYESHGIRDRTHLRFFTHKSLKRLFSEAGYDVLKIEGISEKWWTPSLLKRMLFRLLQSSLSDTKYAQWAIVAKPRVTNDSAR